MNTADELGVSLSPEQRLVLACTRRPLDAEATAAVLSLLRAHAPDWTLVLGLARRQGVLFLVADHLAHLPAGALPEAIAEQVGRLLAEALIFHRLAALQLREVAELIEVAGVPALVLKGPLLAAELYASPSLRPSTDIDLLIHRDGVPRAWRALAASGYRPSHDLDARQQRALTRFWHEHDFRAPGSRPGVDLHWGVQARLCPVGAARIWERAREARLDGWTYRVPSQEDSFLFLCYHAVKHCYRDLRGMADIAAALRGAGAWDMDHIVRQAEAEGGARLVRLAVRMASILFAAPVLPGLDRLATRPAREAALVRRAARSLFHEHGRSDVEYRLSQTAWGLRVLQGAGRKAAFLATGALTPNERDCAMLSLPDSLHFAYYALRLLRLPCMYVRLAARAVSGRRGSAR